MKKFILSLVAALAMPLAMMAQDIDELLPKAKSGDTKAMVALAAAYADSWEDGASEQAVAWYRKAADAGNADAMYKLYEAFNYGNLGLDADETLAEKWLKKAVDKGHAEALYTKGYNIVFDNEDEGFKLIMRGAEAGSANGQLYLAQHFNNSWNESAYNPAKAFQWAKKAAEQNNAEAQYLLGTYYLKGIGTSPNKTEAVKWLKKAAENEFSTAVEIVQWL